jgi:hypothetical protein
MAVSTALVFLLSAFLFLAFVNESAGFAVNITRPAKLVFPDVDTCLQAAIAIVKNTGCAPQVACKSGRTLYLSSCATTDYDLLGFNATYYLDYDFTSIYTTQGIAIYYTPTKLVWTFQTSSDLLEFYSAAIYNTTCNINLNKTALSLVMNTPVNGNPCTVGTSTLLPFDSFTSGPNIVSSSVGDEFEQLRL